MRNNKFLKSLLAGALAITMLAGATVPVSAEPIDPADIDELVITKNLNTTPGTTLPSEADRTFTFQMRYHSAMIGDTVLTNNSITGLGTGAWTPSTETGASFWRDVATVVVPAGTGSGTVSTADLLAGVTWPTAGEFTFYIREVVTTNPIVTELPNGNIETLTFDETVYRVTVQVTRNTTTGDLEVTGMAIWVATGPNADLTEAGKVGEVEFNNRFLREIPSTYCPTTDPNYPDCEEPGYNSAGLFVSKTVTGDGGDTEQLFDFIGTITHASDDPDLIDQTRTYRAWVYEPDEDNVMVRTGTYHIFGTTTAEPFQLRHGQELRFERLPVGTQFVFTETNAHAHTPSVIVTANGVASPAVSGTAAAGVTTGPDAYRTGETAANSAAFTNNRTVAPITGLLADNLPLILVGLAGVGLIGLLAVSRRRRAYDV